LDSIQWFSLDDNPFEREIVKKEIPEIAVTLTYRKMLPTTCLFCTSKTCLRQQSFTEEDIKRNESVQGRVRKEQKRSFNLPMKGDFFEKACK